MCYRQRKGNKEKGKQKEIIVKRKNGMQIPSSWLRQGAKKISRGSFPLQNGLVADDDLYFPQLLNTGYFTFYSSLLVPSYAFRPTPSVPAVVQGYND